MVEQDPEEILPPARPPTPPRESSRQQESLVNAFSRQRTALSRSSSASNITPDSSIESPNQSAIRKKVGFSDSTQYSDPPTVSFDGKSITRQFQPLPPSAERKPTKSILKAYKNDDDMTASGKLLPPHQHKSFAKMLESIILHLSKGDRSSKLDGYLTLSGSLKASESIPDLKALREKTGLLCQFIGRDLTDTSNEKPDYALIVHALTLLSCLMFKQAIAECIPIDFQALFVDHAIKVFAEGGMSKEVARHLLLAMAHQNFSVKVMTSERVAKLVSALHKIEKHFSGKSVVQGRIQIYRTLVRQSRSHMITHTLWVNDLLTDMLSRINEVRQLAITFGLESSFALGTEKGPSYALNSLLKLETEEKISYAEFYASDLKEMIKKKESCLSVPQIWSVIILFQRYKPQQLETWKQMPLFLGVLQLCFNNSDRQLSMEAHYAWNRLIYAFHLTEQTPSSVRAIVFNPLITQLKARKSQTPHTRALGGFYNLLYYAFRPNSTPTRLDLYWDEYVVPLVKALTPATVDYEFASRDVTDAATTLLWLFESTPPRKWTDTRAMENLYQNQIQVNELPSLDSKWLRKNAIRVHPLLSRLLDRMYWNLSDKTSVISRLWHAYITSIASPATMEVKVAIETMMSIASIFSYLYRTWNAGPTALPPALLLKGSTGTPPTKDFLVSFENIITTVVQGLGVLSFTEKLLSIKQDTFEAVATPSHQPKKMRSEIKCPLHHLVLLLAKVSPGLPYDLRFNQMVHRILWPFVEVRKTTSSKMDLIKDLINLLPAESTPPVKLLWQVLASFAAMVTDTRGGMESKGLSDEPLGSHYRSLVRVLEIGIRLSPNEPMPSWKTLLDSVSTSASLDAGDAGKAIAITEPLSRALLQKSTGPNSSPNELFYLHFLLSKATFPRDRQALEAARKKLWGTGNSGMKLSTFDPYEKLYDYLHKSLEETYALFSKHHLHVYADTISATNSFFVRCPPALLLGALAKSQRGLSIWIKDKEGKLGGGSPLGKAMITFWSTILKFIPRLLETQSHTKVLAAIEVLICSGLESKHKTLVNASINAWNSTFGVSKSSFEYPERVKVVLLNLRAENDEAIDLPFFPDSLISEPLIDEGQILRFTDSQDDYGDLAGPSTLDLAAINTRVKARPESSALRRVRSSTPQVIIEIGRNGSLKRSRSNTPDQGNKITKKRAVTPKLRHDDSQIHFEAVESSPIIDRVVDSQILTEKQKETRKRQQDEAAMFPDLHSSPRARTKSVGHDLPVHRSSSKLRGVTSPKVLRQATPTLVQPSDDDPYVNSSPTPTRSIREGGEVSESTSPEPELVENGDEIPSSPPRDSPEPVDEIGELEELPSIMDDAASELDDDLPPQTTTPESETSALPTEAETEPSNNLSENLGHSAQLDPLLLEMNRSLSSYVPTPERADEILSSPSRQLRASEEENELYNQSFEGIVENTPIPLEITIDVEHPNSPGMQIAIGGREIREEPRFSLPSTPIRIRSASPTAQQSPTPKTPQFVDANTSPASSNNNFEDAVENTQPSPRLNLEKAQFGASLQDDSSPISDLDESSIMRVMDGYDQGLGVPAKQVSFVGANEDSSLGATRNSRAMFENSDAVISPSKLEKPEQSISHPLVGQEEEEEEEEAPTKLDQSSSMPSLIPETPARELVLGVDNIYNDDGKLCTLEDTIVVDTTELEKLERQRALSSRRAYGRRKSFTPSSKKRKAGDMISYPNEVLDSQDVTDAKVQEDPAKTSPSKRRRGRSSKNSLPQNQQALADDSVNQSFQSVDFEASFQSGIEDEGGAGLLQAANSPIQDLEMDDTGLEAIEETRLEAIDITEEPKKNKEDVNINEQSDSEKNPDFKDGRGEQDNRPEVPDIIKDPHGVDADVDMDEDLDVEKEPAVIESASKQIAEDLQTTLQALEEKDDVEVREETIVYETTLFDEPSSGPARADSGIQQESAQGPVPQAPLAAQPEVEGIASGSVFDGVRTKLQSIITDLRSAVFSRREVDDLEDMFYEAKKELCIIAEKRRSGGL